MSLPHIDDGELLPPEVATDEPPVREPELDEWVEQIASKAEMDQLAIDDPLNPVVVRWGGPLTEDMMPPTVRAFVNGDFDPERAEWAMAQLAHARDHIKEQAQLAEAYHRRIEAWYARATRTAMAATRFFDGYLCDMLRKANAADDKVKSITLPSGTIRSRGPSPGNELVADFTDQAKFIDWAKDNRADMLRTKHEALISVVRDNVYVTEQGIVAMTNDGEMVSDVPGLMVRRVERTFSAEPL